jgi:hypothetical protein
MFWTLARAAGGASSCPPGTGHETASPRDGDVQPVVPGLHLLRFSAIILLLVLTEVDQPVIIERRCGHEWPVAAPGSCSRSAAKPTSSTANCRAHQHAERGARDCPRAGDLTNVKGEFAYAAMRPWPTSCNRTGVRAGLTAEMDRLLKPQRHASAASVGGIPVVGNI